MQPLYTVAEHLVDYLLFTPLWNVPPSTLLPSWITCTIYFDGNKMSSITV